MEPNKKLLQIYKTEPEKTKIIINNVLKMVGNRIYIDKNGEKQRLLDPEAAAKKVEEKGDGVFIFDTLDGNTYALKIVFQKISAIGKQSALSDFLKEYVKFKKIIVAHAFNTKIEEHIVKQRTQIFEEDALLQDIISQYYQPRFELLSPHEMEQVKKEYNVTNYTIEKFTKSDPVTKYFALKRGDIIRIIRPSPTSGEAIAYRIVM